MKFDIGVLRTVVRPDITTDEYSQDTFTEAGYKFTVNTHYIPGTPEDAAAKKLTPFNPDMFDTLE